VHALQFACRQLQVRYQQFQTDLPLGIALRQIVSD
jgi:hypothetical protein